MRRSLPIPRLGPAAAPARFPYNNPNLAEASTADPAAWCKAMLPYFDAIYGPVLRHHDRSGRPSCCTSGVAERLAAARQWRIDNKPIFDAIFGPEPVCPCGAAS